MKRNNSVAKFLVAAFAPNLSLFVDSRGIKQHIVHFVHSETNQKILWLLQVKH